MRHQSYKHGLASALTVLILLVLVPAAIAEPASSPASVGSATAAGPAAPAVDPSASGVSATPDQSSGPAEQPEPSAAGSGPPATDPSSQDASQPGPSTATPPAAPSEGSDQRTNPQPAPPSASSTVQAIVQVQSLGCTAHCVGSSQSQVAQQTNLTIQPPPGSGPVDAGGPQNETKLVQLQLGCLAHCFGSTTTDGGAHGGPGAVHQGLASPPPSALPNQDPGHGTQSVVDQSSSQFQNGGGAVNSQSQIATQVSASVRDVGAQLDSVLSLLGANPSAAVSALTPDSGDSLRSGAIDGAAASRQSPAEAAVNQVEQAIWQLQIGCLVFCTDTDQSQRAEQATTTVGVSGGAPSVAPVTQSYQLVWQLQIGCLFWCYDAVETQTATIFNSVVSVLEPDPPPGPGGSSGAGGTASGPGGAETPGGGPGSPLPTGVAPPTEQDPSGLPMISPPGIAMISPPGIAMISPPGVAMISPPDVAMIRPAGVAPLSLVMPELRSPNRVIVHTPPPSGLPLTQLPQPGTAASPVAIPNLGEALPTTTAPREAPAHRVPTRGPGQHRRQGRATHSEAIPPPFLASLGRTPWWLFAFSAVLGLLAMALLMSDLRKRRTRRSVS